MNTIDHDAIMNAFRSTAAEAVTAKDKVTANQETGKVLRQVAGSVTNQITAIAIVAALHSDAALVDIRKMTAKDEPYESLKGAVSRGTGKSGIVSMIKTDGAIVIGDDTYSLDTLGAMTLESAMNVTWSTIHKALSKRRETATATLLEMQEKKQAVNANIIIALKDDTAKRPASLADYELPQGADATNLRDMVDDDTLDILRPWATAYAEAKAKEKADAKAREDRQGRVDAMVAEILSGALNEDQISALKTALFKAKDMVPAKAKNTKKARAAA